MIIISLTYDNHIYLKTIGINKKRFKRCITYNILFFQPGHTAAFVF